jgi:exopolysaccharide production protein ExoZ
VAGIVERRARKLKENKGETAQMPKANWNIGIQILRGIAATLVVLHHSLEESLAVSPHIWPNWAISFGASGVDIFFVISGFIIYCVTYGQESRTQQSAISFLIKRFIRIFPLYWICLFVTLALWGSGVFYRNLPVDGNIFACSLFLLPCDKLIVYVSWTLVYELYFYYLFAITFCFRNARASILATTLIIVSGIFVGQMLPEGAIKHFLTNPIALEFCFGLVISYFIHSPVFRGAWVRYLWLPGFVLIAVAAFLMENPHDRTNGPANAVRFLVWGVPAVLVTLSFIQTRFVSATVNRILVPVGNASYSIYLTHPMTMIVFAFLMKHHVLGATHIPIVLPLVVVTAVAFGLLAHYLVERPILNWLRGHLEHGQSQLKKLTTPVSARN